MGAVLRFAATLTCCTLALSSAYAQSETLVVVAAAPVRIMPDASRVPLATLEPGAIVRVQEHEGDWYRVSFRDLRWGWRVGYVQAEHVEAKSHAAAPAVPQHAEIAGAVAARETTAAEAPAPELSASIPTEGASETSASTPAIVAERSAAEAHYGGLSKRAVSESILIGRRQYNRAQGLQLTDSARQSSAEFGGVSRSGMATSAGLTIQVFTPLAWIRQLAGEAKAENRKLGVDDLSEESTEAVLRVSAYLSIRNPRTSAGGPRTPIVQQVVLRNPNTGAVVQPISVKTLRSQAANAANGRPAFEGLLVKFPMAAVRELRGAVENREFLITVTSSTHETRNFRVSKDDFDKLPGR